MQREPYFDWDAEQGIATCILDDGKNTFIGMAQCHEDDFDFKSEKTGCEIAERRAFIKALQYHRNNELKPGLDALKQLYYSMKHSKRFNEKSYEARKLFRQIQIKEDDIATVNGLISMERDSLKKLIDDKDKFYQQVRANRDNSK